MVATNAVLRKSENVYQRVSGAESSGPWLHGVEHMQADPAGNILWKGQKIEYYRSPYDSCNAEQFQGLAERCLFLEGLGITPNKSTVIWHWALLKDLSVDNPWLDFFKHNPTIWTNGEALVFETEKRRLVVFSDNNIELFEDIDAYLDSKGIEYNPKDIHYYKLVKRAGLTVPLIPDRRIPVGCTDLAEVISFLEDNKVPHDLLSA
ncbi:hypothetical protein [Microbulbifer epialgicus]|uniref:Uncharacterized protein n=1 Tax=Microbulbifer epialgicus TaxID=393907 RepID=A0ABV4NV06_9GAMM